MHVDNNMNVGRTMHVIITMHLVITMHAGRTMYVVIIMHGRTTHVFITKHVVITICNGSEHTCLCISSQDMMRLYICFAAFSAQVFTDFPRLSETIFLTRYYPHTCTL